MITYTYSEARQKLASLLDRAQLDGEVLVRRKDGQLFTIRPMQLNESPLDVDGIDTDMSMEELMEIQREMRERPV
ncbi:MAG: type II toxin-antitoxin system Phd/YefM family antitoxin [Candidatus Cloacimonetes bacterium]|nr:type II toxin-antitoxin system Phd/YefM family antitoxin [Candidatus Cloacimonadota bacterium]